MDKKVDGYQDIIKRTILEHAEYTPSHGNIEVCPIFDIERSRYLLVDSGWNKTRRAYSVLLDLRVKDEKVWIEVDGTERGIAYELVDAGILKTDIVFGFLHPNRRKLVEFTPETQ